jgi:phosphoglycolate phosphatase
MNYNLVIFDLGGTVVDTKAHWMDCMWDTFNHYQVTGATSRQLNRMYGDDETINIIQTFVPGVSTRVLNAMYNYYSTQYDKYDKPILYPGVEDTLKDLHGRGVYLATATNGSRVHSDSCVNNSGLHKYITYGTSKLNNPKKPKPDMIKKIQQYYNIDDDKTLYVGDRISDVKTGQNAGVDVAAVTYGAHDKKTLSKYNPAYLINSIDKLKSIIK